MYGTWWFVLIMLGVAFTCLAWRWAVNNSPDEDEDKE
ncbi:uncharacterized protein METZ01_LOCUS373605 [marine metagenome]|uniref:Uncharacterized protein n=1 Tax=marine metagenome TaxID=408172 RepID=A0A382TH47_9ZZZZ